MHSKANFLVVLMLAALAVAAGPLHGMAAAKTALVIGNASYRPGYELRNPIADARAIAVGFADLGFDVTILEDSDLATIQRALDAFVPKAIAGDAAVIYYAGHGATINGRSFLLPVDFSMASFDELDKEAFAVDRLQKALLSTHSELKLLLFDACRNNPLETRGAVPLQQAEKSDRNVKDMLVAFSTTQGAVALDGQGQHSPFAEGLLEGIAKPDKDVEQIMRDVRNYVLDKSGGHQTVWTESSITRPFFFKAAGTRGKIGSLSPPEPAGFDGLVFPDSDKILLTSERMAGQDAGKLRLARNEILARRGGIFSDAALTEHFSRFDWYHPSTYDPRLSDTEATNLKFIRQYELLASAPSGGMFFPDSDRRLLEKSELAGLNDVQLRAARNEIYARRGRKFVVKEVRDYFRQFDWYRPEFGEVELTYIEQKNVDLIRSFEKK